MTRRTKGLLGLVVLVGVTAFLLPIACEHFIVPDAGETFEPGEIEGARLFLLEELAVCEAEGGPAELGDRTGTLLAEPMGDLLDAFFSLLSVDDDLRKTVAELEPHIPPDHLAEIRAAAAAAGVDEERLLTANLVLDTYCTVFVARGEASADGRLICGRNMDFGPAHLLGPRTLLEVLRPKGKKAFLSVTWPGSSAVISGMNVDGLVVAALVNYGGGAPGPGLPVGFLIRRMLEECGTVDETRRLFASVEPASSHFVFAADANDAVVLCRGREPRGIRNDVLTCSNAAPRSTAPHQSDERTCALAHHLAANRGAIDAALARRILTSSYLPYINAQAMVFEPAKLRMCLARGTTLAPAAAETWWQLDLVGILRGESRSIPIERCPDVEELPHYEDHDYDASALRGLMDQ